MKNLSSWLITIFLVMFWAFRILVAVMGQMELDFVTKPLDINIEIILLFVVLACIPFIFKRKIIGAIVCLLAYGCYFGGNLLQNLIAVMEGQTLGLNVYLDILIAGIAIILPLMSVFDILLDRSRKKNPIDKKTDWFYKNEKYDRELDERSDKNQYRTGL